VIVFAPKFANYGVAYRRRHFTALLRVPCCRTLSDVPLSYHMKAFRRFTSVFESGRAEIMSQKTLAVVLAEGAEKACHMPTRHFFG